MRPVPEPHRYPSRTGAQAAPVPSRDREGAVLVPALSALSPASGTLDREENNAIRTAALMAGTDLRPERDPEIRGTA